MNRPIKLSYPPLACISFVYILVFLAGCTVKITPFAAILEDRQEKITLQLQVSSSDLSKLRKPGLVTYLGLGDCRKQAGEIFSEALLKGSPLLNTSDATPKETQTTATLTADFDDRKVLNYDCAFVKGTSMSGNGAVSDPVKVRHIGSAGK